VRFERRIFQRRAATKAALGYAAHHGLSTFWCQWRRILMDVYSVLRGTLKLRNLSFLGSDRMDNLLEAHI
jgi:hypothetical protein